MHVHNELMVRGIVVGVFRENCWVIGNRQTGEAICIDPGDDPDEVLALSRDLGVTIKVIACSHGHIDHIMGVRGVQRATGATFLLSNADLGVLGSGWERSTERFGLDPDGAPVPDGFIADNDVVEVAGLQLQAIATPGHTPGSTSFYTDGFLFSGDTLFRGSVGRTDGPAAHDQQMASICTRLTTLPDDTIVLPGHMKETRIGLEKLTNPWIRDWERERALRQA